MQNGPADCFFVPSSKVLVKLDREIFPDPFLPASLVPIKLETQVKGTPQ